MSKAYDLEEGNRSASLGDVFAMSHGRIIRSVLPLVGGVLPAAEDVVAEAFSLAQVNWERVGRYERPELWIRRTALNLAISQHRRSTYARKRLPMLTVGTNDRTVQGESTRAVLDAVMSLPKRQAQMVVLVYFVNETVAESARILKVSESTARVHLRRALGRLSGLLETNEGA